jgi:hypothetical protein
MRNLRLLIIAIATICVLALGAFAFVNRPAVPPADDDIIIKGGSLEIQCGKNHKSDNAGCLSLEDGLTGKFKHKQDAKHITQIVIRNSQSVTIFDSSANANYALGAKPEIVVTYK